MKEVSRSCFNTTIDANVLEYGGFTDLLFLLEVYHIPDIKSVNVSPISEATYKCLTSSHWCIQGVYKDENMVYTRIKMSGCMVA